MRRLTLLASALGLATSAHAAPDDLGRYQWKSRVLVIFSAASSPQFDKQRQVIAAQQPALADRDLVVLVVDGKTVSPLFGNADGLRAEAVRADVEGPSGKSFQVVLVGKDGLVKLRQNSAVSGPQLFGLIDAMPMRAREIQKQRQ
jgi:hypothetical protein